MITFLAGGKGTLRLIRGFRALLNDQDLAVVANTADTLWTDGSHIAPTLDNAMLLFAGLINMKTWHGVRGDTAATSQFLDRIGISERIPTGDRERAIQIGRAQLLQSGLGLTGATELLCGGLGLNATILPATDDRMEVRIATDGGTLLLAEHLIGTPDAAVNGAWLVCEQTPRATTKALETISASEAIIIAQENPFTAIAPILACEGIREMLKECFVIVISPLHGSPSIGADAARFLEAEGMDASTSAVFELYADIADCFIQDIRDPFMIETALRLDTRIGSRPKSESLAWDLLSIIGRAGRE